jgi:hypothetical protein
MQNILYIFFYHRIDRSQLSGLSPNTGDMKAIHPRTGVFPFSVNFQEVIFNKTVRLKFYCNGIEVSSMKQFTQYLLEEDVNVEYISPQQVLKQLGLVLNEDVLKDALNAEFENCFDSLASVEEKIVQAKINELIKEKAYMKAVDTSASSNLFPAPKFPQNVDEPSALTAKPDCTSVRLDLKIEIKAREKDQYCSEVLAQAFEHVLARFINSTMVSRSICLCSNGVHSYLVCMNRLTKQLDVFHIHTSSIWTLWLYFVQDPNMENYFDCSYGAIARAFSTICGMPSIAFNKSVRMRGGGEHRRIFAVMTTIYLENSGLSQSPHSVAAVVKVTDCPLADPDAIALQDWERAEQEFKVLDHLAGKLTEEAKESFPVLGAVRIEEGSVTTIRFGSMPGYLKKTKDLISNRIEKIKYNGESWWKDPSESSKHKFICIVSKPGINNIDISKLDKRVRIRILGDLKRDLEQLHEAGVLHTDLRVTNVIAIPKMGQVIQKGQGLSPDKQNLSDDEEEESRTSGYKDLADRMNVESHSVPSSPLIDQVAPHVSTVVRYNSTEMVTVGQFQDLDINDIPPECAFKIIDFDLAAFMPHGTKEADVVFPPGPRAEIAERILRQNEIYADCRNKFQTKWKPEYDIQMLMDLIP